MRANLKSLPVAELSQFAFNLGMFLKWWLGEPTEERILSIRKSASALEDLIDFNVLFGRLNNLAAFERDHFGIRGRSFFPELYKIHRIAVELITNQPKGVDKAEAWLLPIAKDAGADADIEAAIYFASRGRKDLLDVDAIRKSWYRAICRSIETGRPVGKVPTDIMERAKSGTLSLSQAASLLTFNDHLFPFASFRDKEEEFIDASICRAVDWLSLPGFEPWLRSMLSDVSVGPQSGIDHPHGAWWLFYWCRSDLALRMADRSGLEAWLWALLNGPIERNKPWLMFYGPPGEEPRYRDYLPLAGIIPFVWARVGPRSMRDEAVRSATELLFQTQLHSGGWPLYGDDSEPRLLTTCLAMHGLAALKPEGWLEAATRAAKWLADQQEPIGCWNVSGGPTVMLTVLALDSLNLAAMDDRVTFKLQGDVEASSTSNTSSHGSLRPAPPDPTYDYSEETWFEPTVRPCRSTGLNDAKKRIHPRIAIVVATDTELRQVLRLLTPIRNGSSVWKVTHNIDVYYLGRFGAFPAVVALSGMGSQGIGGATLSVDSLIRKWNPTSIILTGIAFGADRVKQSPADILVAEHLLPYERQRVGAQRVIFKGPIPPSSTALLNRFRNALDWHFTRPDGSKCQLHFGPILSGEKVVDDPSFKADLFKEYPAAIGGEMEGTGLWAASARAKKEWIVVKGVCDWADGKKHDGFHAMAAAAAASLCYHVLSDEHSLDGM